MKRTATAAQGAGISGLSHAIQDGWKALAEHEIEGLKSAGVFFRRQTPGNFMMRLRMSNGLSSAAQFRTLAALSEEFGKGFVDMTTRQQIQLRWFHIEHVPEMWQRLEQVGLVSLQTGLNNIRGVTGCPAAGLTPNELFDASAVTRHYTEAFLRNPEYTNLPRKFKVTISACLDNCTSPDSQDVGLVPAIKESAGVEVYGFNVFVGGKQGSGGYTPAQALDVFIPPHDAVPLCGAIALLFRDHGQGRERKKSRLFFLIQDWGIEKFRRELERRLGHSLQAAGQDARSPAHTDHVGLFRQRQTGFNYVGLVVPTGRLSATQMRGVATLAEHYGSGEIRLTPSQNLIIPHIPDHLVGDLTQEPILQALRYDPSAFMRGLVSCTGRDYCHYSLIETKQCALDTARHLEKTVGKTAPLTMRWSGCQNGCGNHTTADIGFLGKKVQREGKTIEAVDVFVGGRSGPDARPGRQLLADVPCEELPQVLEKLIPYMNR